MGAGRTAVLTRRSMFGLGAVGTGAILAACAGVDSEQGGGSGPTGAPQASTSSGGGATGSATPATAAQMLARATVPVLCYHQVRSWTGSDSAYTKSYLVIPPANLAMHLDAIAAAGYTTISPDEYHRHLQTGAGLPAKPVMISFDDGKDNQVTAGLNAVTQRQMKATFFIMTVVIGNPGWTTKAQIKKVADAGMTIGSHTWDHHPVPKYGPTDWATQFEKSRETLRQISGQEVLDFAYPYGAWSDAAVPHLKKAGYRAAYQLQDKPISPSTPDYTLRRILTVSEWTGDEVVAELAKV